MEATQEGPYCIVHEEHAGDVGLRFIVAEFSRRRDAEEFAEGPSGDIDTLEDGGDISLLASCHVR